MKIIIDNKLYIQKKDLELIMKSCDTDKIPNNVIDKYKENVNLNDKSFIVFNDIKDIDFLNGFWFVINYNDFKDFNLRDDAVDHKGSLLDLIDMCFKYDKHKYIDKKYECNDLLVFLIEKELVLLHMPSEKEIENYPLECQLLFNEIYDRNEIYELQTGIANFDLPEEVIKPVYYTKKQLQKIYYEVLDENLTFEELKPYEKQLYSIFTRIDYTPNILEIIRKIILINRYNTVDFINDDLLDLLLQIEGHKTKFEGISTNFLVDYLYAIGNNNFENFDSEIILENDLIRMKKIIEYIAIYSFSNEKEIEKLSKYNYILTKIILILKKYKHMIVRTKCLKDIFLNMAVFTYYYPNAINCDYDFLNSVYDYVINNFSEVADFIGYSEYEKRNKIIDDDKFVVHFNGANSLLINLYNKTHNKTHNNVLTKKLIKENNN